MLLLSYHQVRDFVARGKQKFILYWEEKKLYFSFFNVAIKLLDQERNFFFSLFFFFSEVDKRKGHHWSLPQNYQPKK